MAKKRTPAIRRKVVFEHDQTPDFSWLEQDQYNPASPTYDPIWPDEKTMHRWQQLAKKDREAADAYRKAHAYDPEWYRDPENHVALEMIVYEMTDEDEDWRVADSLGSIDFLADGNDWQTGTFYSVDQIPKHCTYLRSLARDAKLPRR